MLFLVDQVAALTEQRDRGALDIALTDVLMDLLKPFSVAVYIVVREATDQRWLPLTTLHQGRAVEVCDPMHSDFHLLTRLQDVPQRWHCLSTDSQVTVESAEKPGTFVICLPLLSDSRTEEAGVIELHSEAGLTAQQQEFVKRVLRVYRNMHRMFMYSERDALTGLLNRKSFDDTFYKTLREESRRLADKPLSGAPPSGVSMRRGAPGERFWLAMVDVDHFKQVNDQYGHQIGDEVLILVGRILKSTFRGYDRIYRFGGEEFVILLRSPDHLSAMQAIERLRGNLEQYQFPQVGRVTASVGLSEIQTGDSPGAACERADQAVYFAKRNGRNRVCSYIDLVQNGLLQTDVKVGGVELF